MVEHKRGISKNIPKNLLKRLKAKIGTKLSKFSNIKNWSHKKMLGKVGKIAAYGLLAYNLIDNLIKGDLVGVAMNIGYFALAYSMAYISQKAIVHGAKLITKGFIKAGLLLKAAGPLLQTIAVGITAYEFYKSVRDLNTSDSSTVAMVVANGILLGVELFQMGVLLLVVAGGLSATSVLASVAGPIGIAVSIMVMVGLKIFQVVKEIEQIEETLKLSGAEKLAHGWYRFWGKDGLEHVERLHKEKFVNEKLRDMCIETLQSSPEFKYCFLPNAKFANNKTSLNEDQSIDLTGKRKTKPTRASPRHFCEYRTFCLPTDIDQQQTLSEINDYHCKNAFGVKDVNKERGSGAHFELGDGDDHILAANMHNRYILGDGRKEIIGNKQQDVFILTGNRTTGTFDGQQGYDILTAAQFLSDRPLNVSVSLLHNDQDFHISYVARDSGNRIESFRVRNIEDLQGRENQSEDIVVPCHLKHFNGNGGSNAAGGEDVINLMENCEYDVTLRLNGYSVVNNRAINGKMVYHVPRSSGHSTVNLRYQAFSQTNVFSLDYKIEEVVDVVKVENNMTKITLINQTDNGNGATYEISVKNAGLNAAFLFKENFLMKLGENSGYLTMESNLTLAQILNTYRDTAEKLGLILRAKSKLNNDTMVVGHGVKGYAIEGISKNVLSNDPVEKTLVIPGKTKNAFLIGTNEDLYNQSMSDFSFPEVIIDFQDRVPDIMDEIELSVMAQKASQYFGMRLYLEVNVDPRTKDIILDVHFENSEEEIVKWIGKIVLKNAVTNSAYKKLKIALYSGLAMEIEEITVENDDGITESSKEISFVAMPINFDTSEHDVIMLSEDDLAFGAQININRELYDYDYYVYNRSLIISNIAKPCEIDLNATTIVLAKFFDKPVMRSIYLNLTDLYIPMRAVAAFHNVHLLPDAAELFDELE